METKRDENGRRAKRAEPERAVYTIDEVAAILGISRQSCYNAARRNELPVIKIGRRTVVPKARLHLLIDRP